MARLYRPTIPLRVKCLVALRQICHSPEGAKEIVALHTFKPRDTVNTSSHAKLLDRLMKELAAKFECEVADLRLDHDPPLGARGKHGRGKTTIYIPPANDPDYLNYRAHGPQFENSHLIKTNVRGDHGQHPDRVLIKREKRRQKAEESGVDKNVKKKRSIRRSSKSAAKVRPAKRKWSSRPMPKGRGFPKRGVANVR